MASPRVVVIGAGPTGLAAALRLVELDARVTVLDAAPAVGGLARSIERWGHSVELGPHILAGGAQEAQALWSRFLGEHPHEVPLRRGMKAWERELPYPPPIHTLAGAMPFTQFLRCACTGAAARVRATVSPRAASTAEEWLRGQYGAGAYEVLFAGYLTKLWGRDAHRLTPAYAAALVGSGKRADAGGAGAAKPVFLHPRGGTGQVWERMAQRIAERGTIRLRASVEGITVRAGAVSGVEVGGAQLDADAIISTMPVARLARLLGLSADAAPLPTRHVMLVHLHVPMGRALHWTWLYVADSDVRVGRIMDSRTWSGSGSGAGVLALEYWCADGDGLWDASDADVERQARDDLRRACGDAVGVPDAAAVMRLAHALPAPTIEADVQRHDLLTRVHAVHGLQSIGRHGAFTVDGMADALASGWRAANQAMGVRNLP